MFLNITITLLLVFLNGFFVAAEFAIVKVRASQIELRIRTGSKLAKTAKHLINHLDSYLSATQFGITLASLGLGWIGESVVAEIITDILLFFGISMTAQAVHSIALPTAFVTITVLHIIFGELAPKSMAIQRSEQVALFVSVPLRIFYIVFSPFIWLLNSIANKIIRLAGFTPAGTESDLHSSDELRYLLDESQKSGVIDDTEHELLENIFEFSETPIKQIMVPRNKVVGIEISMKSDDIISLFIEEGYSRLPVYEKNIDNVIGVIYAKDFISMVRHKELIIIQDLIRPAYFVQEEQKISILQSDMRKKKIHMAIVLDEFGGMAGIVTLEDIIEEIFGEIQDEYDEETPLVEQIGKNEFSIHASTPIDDANDYLPEPLPESEDYETIGGLITSEIGRIPEENENIEIGNYNFSIVKSSEMSVELVKLTYKNGEEEDKKE